MSYKGNFLNAMLAFVATSGQDRKDAPKTATELFLDAIFFFFKINLCVAILKHKLMDAPKVAALLDECNLN